MPTSVLWIQNTPVPPHTCPACRHVHDAVTHISDEPVMRDPEPGDVSICAHCQAVSIFEAGGRLRLATDVECAELPDWAKLHMLFGDQRGQRRN